jgi:immune inhibitor A
MDFTKKILQVYASPHSRNVWGFIEGIGWRKVQSISNDGSTNMFAILVAARSRGVGVRGTLTDSGEISILYL